MRFKRADLDASVRDASPFFSVDPTSDAQARELVDACAADGDTLGGIAVRHSISLSSLRSANKIKGNMLHVGRELVIPTS